ncbi:hypothetical protein LTR84_005037 [Exophiala bonariae]|uniref:Clr5 domain-containing protein n=1 Tax=Exophiala bonariae TaxID=1690606 RepID=A0AAV9NNP2_9EURO|nr:hypothetical protein LTR84_005037 [Exophiala bonariae]
MAPRVRFEQGYQKPPPGYSWATEVKADEKQSSPPAENVPPVRLHSTLVFEMPKLDDWDQLTMEIKFRKKRDYLCRQWGEESFTFLEDDLHIRKFCGRIIVNKQDYYTRFEAWKSESFGVQYHNTMNLLENGLKMNDEDFSNLKSKLGISDAELFCALTNEIDRLQPPPAKVQSPVLKGPSKQISSQLIKGWTMQKPVKSVTESFSAQQTASRGQKRNHSKIDTSSVQNSAQTDKSQKQFEQPPQKRAKLQEPKEVFSKPVTQQRTPIPLPYGPVMTRRRLCKAKVYGQGFRENQHTHTYSEEDRFERLGAQYSQLECAARTYDTNDKGDSTLRGVLRYLALSTKARLPTQSNISEHPGSITLRWYWTIHNDFMKKISELDPLTQAAWEELDTLRARGMLTRELEMLRTTEMRQHSYQTFYGKWEAMIDNVLFALANSHGRAPPPCEMDSTGVRHTTLASEDEVPVLEKPKVRTLLVYNG